MLESLSRLVTACPRTGSVSVPHPFPTTRTQRYGYPTVFFVSRLGVCLRWRPCVGGGGGWGRQHRHVVLLVLNPRSARERTTVSPIRFSGRDRSVQSLHGPSGTIGPSL